MRIDVHHHFLHRDHMAEEAERVNINHGPARERLLGWTPEVALEAMDRNGIDAAIGSITTPGVWFGDVDAARRLSRRYNERSAEVVQRWPKRFGMFGVIAPPDTDGALAEIAYCLDTLRADGVCIFTNYDGRYPGDPGFEPIFEELDSRAATLFVHPTFSVSAHALPEVLPPLIEFPFDTTRAILSVVMNDMPTKYPRITWIFSHAGGAVPMLAGRIEALLPMLARKTESHTLRTENTIAEIRKLHFDVTGAAAPGSLAALRALMPLDRLLFGSDLPMVDPGEDIKQLGANSPGSEELATIESGNALALFPRLSC